MQPSGEHSDPEWARLLQIHQMNQTAAGLVGDVAPSACDLGPVDENPAKKRQRIETVGG